MNGKDKYEKEIVEAYFTKKAENKCVSKPSILLSNLETTFLEIFL